MSKDLVNTMSLTEHYQVTPKERRNKIARVAWCGATGVI